jgi:glycosyltransferase involved in cell wall biosynthesis
MAKLKVLHVIPTLLTGGAERLVTDLVIFSDRSKFEVSVLSICKTESIFEKELEEKGFKIHSLNFPLEKYLDHKKRYLYYLPIVLKTRRYLQNLQPDILHFHLGGQKFLLPASLFLRIPVKIRTIHTVAEKDAPGFRRFFNKLAFKFFGVVPVSISKEVAKTVAQVYGSKIFSPVIYNGIDTQRFIGSKKIKRPNEELILINVARFERVKNHKLLIEAFEEALMKQPNMELWLVGDGSLRREIELLVQKKDLTEKVKFLGIRSDIPQLLNQVDMFVLSSDYEGFGLVVAEAMAAGIPVISTAVAGVKEILENGKYGVLVPVGDAEALAKAIVELAKDERKRAEFSEQGRKVAVGRFDIRNTVKKYEELYLSLLDKNKR